MNQNKSITKELFKLVTECFNLSEEYQKKLNLNVAIDDLVTWGTDLHGLVNLSFEVEKKFGIEINDYEMINLTSGNLAMWFSLIRKKALRVPNVENEEIKQVA